MDQRLYDYLKEKSELLNKNPLKISHRQIAADLGTAREVVSRVMKKLENEEKLEQRTDGIKITGL
jgi:CRP/FNR family transcriptional regulator